MPQILIRCPKYGKSVPTGLMTEKIKFESLSGIQFALLCPACGRIHRWKRPNAWVEGDPPVEQVAVVRPRLRTAGSSS
jgi:hypothetical protein